MKQGTAQNSIIALGGRPDIWLAALLVWALVSAGRSLGTAWAAAAGTEALRWGGGIGLALTLGWFLRRTEIAGQFLVMFTGALALFGILGGETAAHSGLVGPYHDHQLYGSVLLLLLPLSAATALSAPSLPWRWGGLAALTAGTLCLLLSQTRSAWIGLAFSILVFGWLSVRRSSLAFRPQRRRVVLIPIALLLIGLCLAWLLAGPTSQKAVMTHRASTLTALPADGSWQARLRFWRGTARLIAAHPAFGIGLGRYPGQQWFWTRSGNPLPPYASPSLSEEAHSFYGQTTAEMGLVGLWLYLAALATFAAQAVRRLRRNQSRERLDLQTTLQTTVLIATLSALAGQGVDALASPSWQFPEVSYFFWAVLGLGLAALRQDESQAVPTAVPGTLRRAGQWAVSGGLAVVLTAQVLPIGLLSPVEAYDHTAATHETGVILAQASCTSGTGTCFSLIATYSDGGVHDVTFDTGGASNTPAAFRCHLNSSPGTSCRSSFGTGSTANQLTISPLDNGQKMQIAAGYSDLTYSSVVGQGRPNVTSENAATIIFTPPSAP